MEIFIGLLFALGTLWACILEIYFALYPIPAYKKPSPYIWGEKDEVYIFDPQKEEVKQLKPAKKAKPKVFKDSQEETAPENKTVVLTWDVQYFGSYGSGPGRGEREAKVTEVLF